MKLFSLFFILLAVFIVRAEKVWDFSSNDPANRHFTTEWAKGIRERKIIDGALYGVTKGHPSYFSPTKIDLPLDRANTLIVEMMAKPGADRLQVYANVATPSQSFEVKKLITDGKYHFYTFDFTKMPKVKGAKVLKNFRINPDTSMKGAAFAIKSIRLSGKRVHVPGVTCTIPEAPATLKVPNFFQLAYGGKAAAPTQLELSYNSEGIIIKYETAINNVSYAAKYLEKDSAVYNDDCFDLTFKTAKDHYYQLVFNPRKATFDQKVIYNEFLSDPKMKNTPMGCGDLKWDAQAKIESFIAPGRWYGSVFVPFKSLGLDGVPGSMEMNIGRSSRADSKGLGVWNYSPIERFATPENMRKVTFGKTASAVTYVKNIPGHLPGENQIEFANPDRRPLEFRITVRDRRTGQRQVFTTPGKSASVNAKYQLGESDYELFLNVFEAGKMIFFDAFTVDNSQFRKRLAEVYRTVQNWSGTGTYASVKKRLLTDGAKLIKPECQDFAAIRKYIAEVDRINVVFKQQELYQATVKNFQRRDLPFAVAAASSADKIFRSLDAGVPAFAGKSTGKLVIESAANEVEGTQLVLVNMNKPVKGLKFKVVKKPAGKAPEIKLYGVDFLDTRTVLETKYAVTFRGEWPDVLAVKLFKTLAPGEVRSIWVNAETASDVPAGEYNYILEVTCQGLSKPLSVPLTVKVWGFALPVTPGLRTAVSNYDGFSSQYYERLGKRKFTKAEKKVMTDRLVRFVLKHRLNPGHIYTMRAYGKTFVDHPDLNRLGEYAKLGLNAVPVGQMPHGTFQGTLEMMKDKYYRPERWANFLDTMKKTSDIATKQNMQHTMYIHAFDEVFAATHKYPKMRELAKMVKELKAVAPSVKIECITDVEKDLIGVIDIWCPSIKMMTRKPETYWARQKAGDELWLYTCLGAPGHVAGEPPSFVLEESAAAMRLIGWICHFYRAEGFLYYAISNWVRNGNPGEKPYPAVPWNIQYVNSFNGEACLYYPSGSPHQDPLSSIRLENLRDGFEDYDYLKMLADQSKKFAGKLSAAEKKEIAGLLKIQALVRSGFDYTDDSEKILNHRRQIAKWLEKFNQYK